MCELCGEKVVYGTWVDRGSQQSTRACRRCLRQLSIAEARRKQSLELAPLTDTEVDHLLFTKYLIAEGVINEQCEEYEAAEL